MLILTFTNIQNREIIFKNQLVFGPMPDGYTECHLVTNSSVPDEVRWVAATRSQETESTQTELTDCTESKSEGTFRDTITHSVVVATLFRNLCYINARHERCSWKAKLSLPKCLRNRCLSSTTVLAVAFVPNIYVIMKIKTYFGAKFEKETWHFVSTSFFVSQTLLQGKL